MDAWKIGLCYDVNLSELVPASKRRGGFEIAIAYLLKRKIKLESPNDMSRLHLNIKLIIILLIVLSSIKVTSQNTEVMIDLGIKAFEKGSYFEANNLFSNALKIDSSKIKLQFYHGFFKFDENTQLQKIKALFK